MPRLRDRNHQIPGGFVHELGSLGWRSAPFASFNTIVDQVFNVIKGNQNIALSRGWPIDRPGIENWVDRSNAQRCQDNGWNDFILPDEPQSAEPNKSEQWPLWARTIAKFRKEGEVGIGDTIKRVIGNDNSEAFKKWYKSTFNRDCGCCGRQQNLNVQYRYL
jgi:hypothetical protein